MPRKKIVPKTKSVLVMFMNPAGVQEGEVPKGTPTRDNQPWLVYFASLGVILQAEDRHGNPITGYWDVNEAGAWAQSVYSQLVADPEYLVECRANPAVLPAIWDGWKSMSRRLVVPA